MICFQLTPTDDCPSEAYFTMHFANSPCFTDLQMLMNARYRNTGQDVWQTPNVAIFQRISSANVSQDMMEMEKSLATVKIVFLLLCLSFIAHKTSRRNTYTHSNLYIRVCMQICMQTRECYVALK